MIYALVENGLVVNIVEWDGNGDIFSEYITVPIDDMTCGIGWSYSNGKCTPPDDFYEIPTGSN